MSVALLLPWENESLKSIKSYKVHYKVKTDEKLINGPLYFAT